MEFLRSLRLFTWGILKRFYWMLPTLLVDPFDLLNTLFGVDYNPPTWIVWALFSFGLFLAASLAYHELRSEVRTQGQKRDRRLMREDIGDLSLRAQALLVRVQDEKSPAPITEVEELGTEIMDYVDTHLGKSYVARLVSSSGLPTGFTTLMSREHRVLEGALRLTIARLNEFIAELSQ